MKTDAQIQADVLSELRGDTRVKPTDVGVEVDQGVVTLTGAVVSYPQRGAAQEAAHRVAGVLDVANDIDVKLPSDYMRSDTDIAHAVRLTLEWDVLVPDQAIRSTVSNGWVTLEGSVDHTAERLDAEHTVRNLAGVKGVVNRIAVSPPHIDARDVREEIEGALERRADRAAKRIQVEVRDGEVTLTGPVHSWAERTAVIGAARFTPGVRSVSSHLHIDPSA